ncbi:MAG: WhiB family transcriptional regulator [Acidimicrobiales bacterium]
MALAHAHVPNDAERKAALWAVLAADADVPDLPTGRPSWHAHAACHGQADVMFSEGRAGIAKARAICDRCPAKVRCATDAIERDERYGIWGGLTPADRLNFKRNAKRG